MKNPNQYSGIEERLAGVLRAYDYEDRTIVQSFSADSLQRLRGVNPRLRLGLLYSAQQPPKGDPPPWAFVLGPEWPIVANDRALVRDAHAAGRQVVVWTLDNPGQIRQAIDARVDGIITNRPDLARAMLDGR